MAMARRYRPKPNYAMNNWKVCTMRRISVATWPDCLCQWQAKSGVFSPLPGLSHCCRNRCVNLWFVDQYLQFNIDSLWFSFWHSSYEELLFPVNANLIPAMNACLLRTLWCLMRYAHVVREKNEWWFDPNLMPNDWLVNPNSLRGLVLDWVAGRSRQWVNLLQVFERKKHFYSGHGGHFVNCSSTASALEIACLATCASRFLNSWTWSQSKPSSTVPMRQCDTDKKSHVNKIQLW